MQINHINYIQYKLNFTDFKDWKGLNSGQIKEKLEALVTNKAKVDFPSFNDDMIYRVICKPEDEIFVTNCINQLIKEHS